MMWDKCRRELQSTLNVQMEAVIKIVKSFYKSLEDQLFQNFIETERTKSTERIERVKSRVMKKMSKLDKIYEGLNYNSDPSRSIDIDCIRYVFSKDKNKVTYKLKEEVATCVALEQQLIPDQSQVEIKLVKTAMPDLLQALHELNSVQIVGFSDGGMPETEFKETQSTDQLTETEGSLVPAYQMEPPPIKLNETQDRGRSRSQSPASANKGPQRTRNLDQSGVMNSSYRQGARSPHLDPRSPSGRKNFSRFLANRNIREISVSTLYQQTVSIWSPNSSTTDPDGWGKGSITKISCPTIQQTPREHGSRPRASQTKSRTISPTTNIHQNYHREPRLLRPEQPVEDPALLPASFDALPLVGP